MRRPFYAVLVLVLTCSAAGADPITVTSGKVVLTDEPGEFSFIGRGFELSGWMFPSTLRGTFWFDRCGEGCLPGARVDFGSTTYGVGTGGEDEGQGTIGGVVHQQLFYSGEWTFHGPSVIVPPLDGQISIGHFAFEGSIFAYPTDARSGTPLFAANLRGGGTARVFFGGSPTLIAHDIDYLFEPQPVPEPSTLFLLGTGLAAALTRCRRRSARTE